MMLHCYWQEQHVSSLGVGANLVFALILAGAKTILIVHRSQGEYKIRPYNVQTRY